MDLLTRIVATYNEPELRTENLFSPGSPWKIDKYWDNGRGIDSREQRDKKRDKRKEK